MVEKAEFRNRTEGYIGAVVYGKDGVGREGVSIAPGDTIWLSDDEQVMTANAPRQPQHNPFIGGSAPDGGAQLELVTEKRPVGGDANARPIGHALDPSPETANSGSAEEDGKAESAVGEKKAAGRRRRSRQAEETGAAAEKPEGDAPQGEYAPGEEVGTPT